MDGEIAIVLTTVGSEDKARQLARVLVEERLAACVQTYPVRSVYRWKGEVQEDQEWQIAIKTTQDRCEALERRIRELHPYELPELARTSTQASPEYASWLRESVS